MTIYRLLLLLRNLFRRFNCALVLMIFIRHELFFKVCVHFREDVESSFDLFGVLVYFLCSLFKSLVVSEEISEFADVLLLFEP